MTDHHVACEKKKKNKGKKENKKNCFFRRRRRPLLFARFGLAELRQRRILKCVLLRNAPCVRVCAGGGVVSITCAAGFVIVIDTIRGCVAPSNCNKQISKYVSLIKYKQKTSQSLGEKYRY